LADFCVSLDVAFLDDAWASQHVNVLTIVAWAGVGKSTLVNQWLQGMAAEHYRSAQFVFGWSFYRRAAVGRLRPQMNLLMRLSLGLGIEIHGSERRGRRAKDWRSSSRAVGPYCVLDGLEPLQNPPGPHEGRLREPALQALLRELAAFNTGLCVITTRLAVADIADRERTSALRRELEQLSGDAGAKLLRAPGVNGHEAELRSASDEFSGHSLALTLRLRQYRRQTHWWQNMSTTMCARNCTGFALCF
jgi:hypothetical protein